MTDAEEKQEPAPEEAEAEAAAEADDAAPAEAEAAAEADDAAPAETDAETDDAAPAQTADDAARDERPEKRRKKKKKRKKRREPGEEPELRPARNADGRDRPRFLLAFPHDPELEKLIEAFEQGDYAKVRREAPALAEQSDDPEVQAAALELRRRIDPDPLARYLLLMGVGLLLFLIIWVYTTKH